MDTMGINTLILNSKINVTEELHQLVFVANGDGTGEIYAATENGLPIPGFFYGSIQHTSAIDYKSGAFKIQNPGYRIIGDTPLGVLKDFFSQAFGIGWDSTNDKMFIAVKVLSTPMARYAVTEYSYNGTSVAGSVRNHRVRGWP